LVHLGLAHLDSFNKVIDINILPLGIFDQHVNQFEKWQDAMETMNQLNIQQLFNIGSYTTSIFNLIFPHLHNEGLIFQHNPLTRKQYGNLASFDVLQNFVTFGVKESLELLQLKHFLGTLGKIGMQSWSASSRCTIKRTWMAKLVWCA
jgi:hypothetical protein